MSRLQFTPGRVVVVFGAVMYLLHGAAAEAQNALPPAPVVVTKIEKQEVAAGQPFIGTVMPLRHSVVGSAVDGRVLEYLVNEGDRVRQGQPLVQLGTEALDIELAAAKAEHSLRKEELAELENGSREEEIEQAKAHMDGAKALMDYREARRKRLSELAETNASSKDALQDSESGALFAAKTFQAAKIAYDMAVKGPRVEKVSQAKAKVVMAAEAVNRIDDQLRKHTIVSPFDGYVVAEHTEVGQWIAKAGPVAEIVEIDKVDIQTMVLESFVAGIKPGLAARVDVEALPGQSFTGSVALIVPKADTRSRSFPVKVRLENPEVDGLRLLMPGMLAHVHLPLGKPISALLVPKDALVLGGPTPKVFVVEPSGKSDQPPRVRAVSVELGVVHEGRIAVKGALEAGQQVVLQGNERLRDGQSVSIVEPSVRRASDDRPARK